MRNGGLRQFHTLLDIGGAEPGFFVEGASAFLFERAECGGAWIAMACRKRSRLGAACAMIRKGNRK